MPPSDFSTASALPPSRTFRSEGRDALRALGRLAYRPTRDLDFTGYGSADEESVVAAVREICCSPARLTNLSSTPNTLRPNRSATTASMTDCASAYGEARQNRASRCRSTSASAMRSNPGRRKQEYPTFLDDPAPSIRAYPPKPSLPRNCTRWSCLASATAATRTSTISTCSRSNSHSTVNASRARLPQPSSVGSR